jgi:DNA-binding SARP family transcriptional activator
VSGLLPRTVELLDAAAVIGRTFSVSLLERVIEMPAEAVLAAVGDAAASGVVEETWAEAGQYSFRHALIHEALYDRMDAVTRARLHRRVGTAIEAAAGALVEPRLSELAHHFLRAAPDGDTATAITYAVRAGERATVTGAYDEAVRHCEAALALLDGSGVDDEQRAELLVTLGDLRRRRGSPRDQTAAARLAEEAGLIGRRLDRADVVARAEAILGDDGGAGRVPITRSRAPVVAARSSTSGVVVRCLGTFEMAVAGRAVDLGAVKPRHRALLRLLAARAGRAVHREELVEALWPGEVEPRSAMRNLQVAVSTLRRLIEPDAGRGQAALLVRAGDSYRLALPADADVDVVNVDRGMEAGRAALAAGDPDGAVARWTEALAAYTGDLLPEDGPAEWVVKARERLRFEVAEVAQLLAQLEFDRGRLAEAAAAGERGLQIDRFRDGLWRLVVAAYDAAGDVAAAARCRRAYAEVLHDLGVGT